MQLMTDAVTVLGSRHGLLFEPQARKAHIIRCGLHPGIECEIVAGLEVNGHRYVFPLTKFGDLFGFMDQDTSPTSIKLTGIDPLTCLKLELTVVTPFRPKDATFSTIPVLDITMKLSRLTGHFRWTRSGPIEGTGKVFFSISCPRFQYYEGDKDVIAWQFDADRHKERRGADMKTAVKQQDRLVVHVGTVVDQTIEAEFSAENPTAFIHASWCTFSPAMLDVYGEPAPFRYTQQFQSIDDVVAWARKNAGALLDNSKKVDGIIGNNSLSRSTNNLLALTLHSWLANTWWTITSSGERFTVWEGSCYYHSTLDVEYTQAPFYLAVWPELLGLQLDMWPRFTHDGEIVLGERGKGTVMFSHDVGSVTDIDRQRYHHHMPVEENTNYILLSYAYWRRSGDHSRVQRHADVIRLAMEFIARCDTTGNGVPDQGMANTIDDASPAVQFGKEQTYLAVKTLAALQVGVEMLESVGQGAVCEPYRIQAEKILKVLEEKGWKEDHFVTLLNPRADSIKDPWSGKVLTDVDEVPGWDAAHIYTTNGLALLDMLGYPTGINEERLRQDLRVATKRCMSKYGCRHSDYMPPSTSTSGEGGVGRAAKVGWISMNMMRDMTAFYRKIDFRHLADRYWEYQVLTNTQGTHLFFETFSGNNLMMYPRGVVIYGYFDALGGVQLDAHLKTIQVNPLNDQMEVPILWCADWEAGIAPMIIDGLVEDSTGLIARSGLKMVAND